MEERRKVGGRTFAGDHHKEPLPACTTLASPAAVRDASGRQRRPRSEQAVGCKPWLGRTTFLLTPVENLWKDARSISFRRMEGVCTLCRIARVAPDEAERIGAEAAVNREALRLSKYSSGAQMCVCVA